MTTLTRTTQQTQLRSPYMKDPAVVVFLSVYQSTRSVEAAILELKRLGWDQYHTTTVIAQLFGVDWDSAERIVIASVAWQAV